MKRILVFLLVLFLTACTPAEKGMREARDRNWKIRLLACDGRVISEWESAGMMAAHGSGWDFLDAKTKSMVSIAGIVTAEEIK